jgi:outer membrane immunogenic protein
VHNRLLKAFALAVALVGALSGSAFAQKAAEAPVWSGPYVGGFLGHAWGSSDITTKVGPAGPLTYFNAQGVLDVSRTGTGSASDDTFVGGVAAGQNFQSGKVVFGIEVDFGSFRLRDTVGGTGVPYTKFAAIYSMQAALETDWLLTARARVGWTPVSNFLLYATGGLAVTKVQVSNSFSDNGPAQGVGGTTSDEQTRIGWTIGGGAELALSRNWSLKAEYLHVGFGSVRASSSVFCGPSVAAQCTSGGGLPNSLVSSGDLSADIMRFGLNYRF